MDKDNSHILIAEDEPAVRAFVARALEKHGHRITAVTHGGEALAILERGERVDLLLTDIVMPVMDGIALALAAGEKYPDLPILMMTGYAHEKQRAHNLEMLVHEVIAKPFSLDQICAAVERFLGKQSSEKHVTSSLPRQRG